MLGPLKHKKESSLGKAALALHSGIRSEPAGLPGLRKQVTKAKGGPLKTNSGGLVQDKLPLSTAPPAVSLVGTLRA